jgi:hypothetical protein
MQKYLMTKRAYLAIAFMIVAGFLVLGARAQDAENDRGDDSQQRSVPPPPPNSNRSDSAQASYPDSQSPDGSKSQVPAPPEPSQSVARISLIHGDVSRLRGDSGDWTATTLNTPISAGDWIATGDQSRVELQLDFANILRLSSSSQAKMADLTHTRIQIQLARGYAGFTQFKGNEAEVEIDTPNVAVHPLKHGIYRVQVNSDIETEVIVREGEVEITTPQGSTRVKQGEMVTVRGSDNPEYRVSRAFGKDDWDRWNKDRDHVIEDAEGYRHTNRYYTGAQDLDAYGHWVYVPGYGNVWSPYRTDAGWAPYQAGRWVWEPYYGWTWVSTEPWGWAPYHYGRWFFYGASWYWWPGPVHVHYRPLWSPAFVVFLGFGHHGGFGFGSIGWLPCGPHDYFYPWYGRGFNRVNVVNVTNINVTNVTVVNNRNGFGGVRPLGGHAQPYMSNVAQADRIPQVRNSVSVVASADFGRGGMAHAGRIDGATFHQAQAMTGNLPVMPGHESLGVATKAPPVASSVQAGGSGRGFFTRSAPPAATPSFQQQQGQMQQVFHAHGIPVQNGGPQGGPSGAMTAAPGGGRPGSSGGVMTPAPVSPVGSRGPGGVMTSAPGAQPDNRTPVPSGQAGGRGRDGIMTPAPPTTPAPVNGHSGGVMTTVPTSPAPTGGMTTAPKPPTADQGSRGGFQTFGSHGAPVAVPPPPPSHPSGVSTPAPPAHVDSGNSGGNGGFHQTPQTPRNDRIPTPPPPAPSGRTSEAPRPPVNINPPIATPRPVERVQRNNPPPPPPPQHSAPAPAPQTHSAPAPRSESHPSGGSDKHSSSGGSKDSHDHDHHH